jgi:ribonuclease HI
LKITNKKAGLSVQTWPIKLTVFTDGASRGNPGPASIGVVFIDSEDQTIHELGEKLGHQTNNFAEYTAVIRALELAVEHGVQELTLKSDSELMVRQMEGRYKVKSPVIIPLFEQARKLAKKIKTFKLEHIRREFNSEADRLANLALDRPSEDDGF